jgi:SNF2 family DNA or RNA helicase
MALTQTRTPPATNEQVQPDLIVLHAGWLDGRLALWGETLDDDIGPPPAAAARAVNGTRQTRPARATKQSSRATPPTYGLPGPLLASLLRDGLPDLAAGDWPPVDITVWLPTAQGRPLSSTALAPKKESTTEATPLAPWRIEALALEVHAALLLLGQGDARSLLAPGLALGSDLRFWRAALRFAATLTVRQAFVPGVAVEGDCYAARWQPCIAGQDEARLAQLAAAMPAACRALALAGTEQDGQDAAGPPTLSARAVVASFVAAVVDALVRGAANTASMAATPGVDVERVASESLHAQWLAALRAPAARLTGTAQDLASFRTQVRSWTQPLNLTLDPSVRLCFRLEEPVLGADSDDQEHGVDGVQAMEGTWHVHYLLQATDDPSLLVPAETIWHAGRSRRRGALAAALERSIARPREKLLAALGRAAPLSPEIEASLRAAEPSGYTLDVAGAHSFLTETAWLLEQAGFGVLLPAWWTRTGTKLRLAGHAKIKSPQLSGGGMNLERLVTVDWQLALGDEPLTPEELEALARLKTPLVRIRGQWVEVSARQIADALTFWRTRGSEELALGHALRLALGAERAGGGLAVTSVTSDGWVADLLARLEGHATLEPLAPPAALHGTLRPYQERGYAWLHFLSHWGLGACLADDMGLGKTIQTLALLQRDWSEGVRRPVLLICPTSVIENWRKEAARFTPELPVLVHHGASRRQAEAFAEEVAGSALVISSYALLHRDAELLRSVPWRGVVFDEAQNLKNPETKQARAARALTADYRAALTGTPVENHVGDLWSLMETLNPGLLGSQADFKRRFFVPIQIEREVTAAAQLKRLTGPFILRRLKTDRAIIADLPDKLEMKVYCTLTKEQASLYAAVLTDVEEPLEEAEGIGRKGLILATLTKLKQICNHPAQFLGDGSAVAERSGKLARLEDMLEEVLATGERALVFTQFAEMGALLRRHLQRRFGRDVLFLHGGVPRAQRDRMVERFQSPQSVQLAADGPAIFILSLKAGGTGLNLTAANHVFHYDRWWNPAVENQATDRAFRIGQRQAVQVHKFICAGTLEERIDALIESKQGVAARVVGTGEGWLTELSTEQLRDLLALRAEAVEA